MVHDNQYRTRAATCRDRTVVTQLWSENIDAHRTTADDRFESVYLANPHGPGALTLLEARDGTARGTQGLLPRGSRIARNRQATLGVLVDMVVDRRSRTLGPALMLLRATLRREEERFSTVYTFCSPNSEPVFRRAGMKPWTDTTIFKRAMDLGALRPGGSGSDPRPRRYANAALRQWARLPRRLLSQGIHVEVKRSFGPEIDDLWHSTHLPGFLVGRRSRADLEWRFGSDRKIEDLRVLCAFSVPAGRCNGYAVLTHSRGGAGVADIYAGSDVRTFLALLNAAVVEAEGSGTPMMTMEFSGPSVLRRAILGSLFVPRDRHTVLRLGDLGGFGLLEPRPYLTAFDREP